MQIQSATYNRNLDGTPASIRIVTDEAPDGVNRDVSINGSTHYNDALTAWLAADPANQIGG